MTAEAPILTGLIGSAHQAVLAEMEGAHAQWENEQRFTDAHDRIRRAIPADLSDADAISRADKAAAALALMAGRDWPGMPADEVSAVQDALRGQLVGLATGHVHRLRDEAAAAYRDLRDGSGPYRALQTFPATAPGLAELVEEQLAAAERVVDAVAERKRQRDMELAADEARRAEEANAAEEQERLAAQSQQLNAAQATFPSMVDAAAASGDWQALETEVNGWSREIQDRIAKTDAGTAYDGWLKAWKQAKRRPKALSEELVALQDVVAQALAKASLEAPAVALPPADGTPEEQATAYCAARHQLQEAVMGRVVKSAAVLRAQGAALGDDPAGLVMRVWAMAGLPDAEEAQQIAAKLSGAQEALQQASAWGERGLLGPATAEQLESAPVAALATADEAYDAAWDGLFHVVDRSLLDSLNTALTYGGFMGLNLNKNEAAQRAVKAVENAAFDALDARDAYAEQSIRDWRQNADPKPFLTLIETLRELEAMIPATP
jgi:hypothetical protein